MLFHCLMVFPCCVFACVDAFLVGGSLRRQGCCVRWFFSFLSWLGFFVWLFSLACCGATAFDTLSKTSWLGWFEILPLGGRAAAFNGFSLLSWLGRFPGWGVLFEAFCLHGNGLDLPSVRCLSRQRDTVQSGCFPLLWHVAPTWAVYHAAAEAKQFRFMHLDA
jgi:hypothetical protein